MMAPEDPEEREIKDAIDVLARHNAPFRHFRFLKDLQIANKWDVRLGTDPHDRYVQVILNLLLEGQHANTPEA